MANVKIEAHGHLDDSKLDIGCGSSKRNGYLGLDIHRARGVDVIASATDLPFKSQSMEAIYSRRCLQHVLDEAKAIKEMYRVLKVNGVAEIIVASYRGWIYYFLKHLLKRKPYPTFHFYTKKRLENKLKNAGFTILQLRKIKTQRKFGYDILAVITRTKS